MSDDNKIIDLEIKIMQQEQIIEDLHQVLYKQQFTIDYLEKKVKQIDELLKSGGSQEIGPGNEKPPHY